MEFKRGYSQCRSCSHAFSYHCLYIQIKQGGSETELIQVLDVIPCNSFVPTASGLPLSGGCGCNEFVPLDNLEYLEWRHNKKEEAKEI